MSPWFQTWYVRLKDRVQHFVSVFNSPLVASQKYKTYSTMPKGTMSTGSLLLVYRSSRSWKERSWIWVLLISPSFAMNIMDFAQQDVSYYSVIPLGILKKPFSFWTNTLETAMYNSSTQKIFLLLLDHFYLRHDRFLS